MCNLSHKLAILASALLLSGCGPKVPENHPSSVDLNKNMIIKDVTFGNQIKEKDTAQIIQRGSLPVQLPNSLIVCIETQPDYPPGTHMMTIKTLKELGKVANDYTAQENERLRIDRGLNNEFPSLHIPLTSIPDDKMGVFVVFKRDCAK